VELQGICFQLNLIIKDILDNVAVIVTYFAALPKLDLRRL
jgi:hypothetical protein